jgi:hypothetical protein
MPTSSTPSGAPSELVTVIFTAYGGNSTGQCPLVYSGGPLKSYLRQAPLLPHGLVKRAAYRGVRNREGKKVRLTYIPVPGDVIVIT